MAERGGTKREMSTRRVIPRKKGKLWREKKIWRFDEIALGKEMEKKTKRKS